MKKHSSISLVVGLLLVSSVLFSGCIQSNNNSDSSELNSFEQKNTTITITGKLTKSGNLYLVTDSAGVAHDVETYSVDFDSRLGETVTVSGQYSGNTLFVSQIIE